VSGDVLYATFGEYVGFIVKVILPLYVLIFWATHLWVGVLKL